jgi:hypothetical protein
MYCNVPEQQLSLLHRHWPLAVCLHLLVEAAVRVRSPSQRCSKIHQSWKSLCQSLFSVCIQLQYTWGEIQRFSGIMPFFFIFIMFNNHSHSTIIHSFILHHSPRPCLLVSSSLLRSAREESPWGAEPRIALGPSLQQADALQNELHRTHTELRRTPGRDILFSKIIIIFFLL